MESVRIDERYLPALNRVFSSSVIGDLFRTGRSDYLSEVVHNSGIGARLNLSKRLRDFFDELHDFLAVRYCSEYIYKNALTEQIYLGRHNGNSHLLTELRVDKCKADVVILNGTSTVYEIKSDLDTFDRLENQIAAYAKFFDRIFVVTSSSQAERLLAEMSSDIGVMVLRSDRKVVTLRDPISNKVNVVPSIIFDSLRQSEYLAIVRERFGTIPDVPNTRLHQTCSDIFCTLSPEEAHDAMLNALKRRHSTRFVEDFLQDIPRSLKACVGYGNSLRGRVGEFLSLLQRRASTVIS